MRSLVCVGWTLNLSYPHLYANGIVRTHYFYHIKQYEVTAEWWRPADLRTSQWYLHCTHQVHCRETDGIMEVLWNKSSLGKFRLNFFELGSPKTAVTISYYTTR